MKDQDSQVISKPTISENRQISNEETNAENQHKSVAEIQIWIVSYIAEILEIESEEVNPTIPFDRYGLDSSAAVGMTGDLEDWLGCEIDPTVLYDYPTIEALAQHLGLASRS